MSDRIKLAEAMGWVSKTDSVTGRVNWYRPGATSAEIWGELTFDPEHDANDCEALILKLAKDGTLVIIGHNTAGSFVEMTPETRNRADTITWSGHNYKQGVCELALKVLDTQEGE